MTHKPLEPKDAIVAQKLTIRQHRIYLGLKLLNPLTKDERQELVTMATGIVSRLAERFPGDEN